MEVLELEVAKNIWKHQETGLKTSGDLFYKWQLMCDGLPINLEIQVY